MTMTLKTCAIVGAAIIAELLFCALFLASLSMASARWTNPGTTATNIAESGRPPTESGQRSTESGIPSAADPMAVAAPSPDPSQTPKSSALPRSHQGRTDLAKKIASMRDMHARLSEVTSAARSGTATTEAVATLLPSMDRLMREALVLMRAMRPGLPATETEELISIELTAASDPKLRESVRDFLELMEALIVMKGDRDWAMTGSAGNRYGIGTGGLERSAPWTREGCTAIGATPFRTLGQPHRGELTGLWMSI